MLQQEVLGALTAASKGVASAARRFRLRCVKSVLLLSQDPSLDFSVATADEDATAMLDATEKRQQVLVQLSRKPITFVHVTN